MKKKNVAKHLISAAVAAAAVFSLGCITLADEESPDVQDPDLSETVEVAEETVSQEASDASEKGTGFYKEDGVWYYYVDGKRQYFTGWKKINGDWYFLDYDAMMTGGFIDTTSENDDFYILGLDGKTLKGWQQWNGDWYYLENNGKAAKGWKQISGKWYYFDEDASTPRMLKDTRHVITDKEGNSYIYYFGQSGAMMTGWQQIYGSWYYFDSVGHAAKGWNQLGGKWYYFADNYNDPYMYCNDVFKIYADKEKNVYAYYGFGEDGALLSGWNYLKDSIMVINGETIHQGGLFYFDSTGKAAVGWKQIDGKWYYFYENGTPYAYRGYNTINGSYYYFDINTGAMFNGGWHKYSLLSSPYYYYYAYYAYSNYQDTWYYFGSDGAAYFGWKQIGGQWYYFGIENGDHELRTGFTNIDGKTYYLGDSGAMRKGWFKIDDKYYYADSTGALIKGQWYLSGGNTYYFFEDGTMATGYQKIPRTYSGKVYDFGTDGVCRNP